jgi:4-amino-4-deoxy-L-arabinose transferase-like glycosyltransferase
MIKKYPRIGIGLIGAMLFIPFLGSVHLFDWDEINFAEVSREMLVLGDYTRAFINYLPFWEKPPFFFWLQAGSMKLFGIGEFASRLPNAVSGIISLIILYDIGKRLKGERFGWIWSLTYLGSILPNFYFQSGIIDPVFNLFIFLSLWFFIRFVWGKAKNPLFPSEVNPIIFLLVAGVFAGFAILTKGPAALAILFLTFFVFWLIKKFKWFINPLEFLLYLFMALLITFIWFGPETIKNGPWFINEFVEYNIRLFRTEDAGHGGFPGYHFIVVFFGCFPASIFMLYALRIKEGNFQVQEFKKWMLILLSVVLVLFSIVQSKIVHYSSMAYFPLTFLASLTIIDWWERKQALPKGFARILTGVALFLGLVLSLVPILALNLDKIIPLVDDPFAVGNMQAQPGWTGFEALGGLGIIASSLLFIRKWNTGKFKLAIAILFFGMALSLKLVITQSVSKVEGHSQAAAIEFFQSLKGQDVYIQPVGYKTYAHYFYSEIQPRQKPLIEDQWKWEEYLFTRDISKPVYFVSKTGSDWKLIENPDVEFLYEKNGFRFYKKKSVGN